MAFSKTIREYNWINFAFIEKFIKQQSQTQWRSAIYVMSQIRFITGLNPKFIRTGFSVVRNVGILFLNIMTIPMVGQESQIDK